MTLLDKIINQSKIQDQLNAQLAEISYRAMNGTRQAPRNFAEGTLNVGTMNFKTPDDKITKEMIMDYQQKEQEKYYYDPISKDNFVNVPTGLTDPTVPYTPIDYGTTGAEADEALLQTERSNVDTLLSELTTLQGDLKTKEKELSDYQRNLRKREKNLIQLRKDEAAFIDKLAKVQTLLSNPTFLTGSPGADKKLLKLKKETEDNIKDIQKDIPIAEKEILDIQTTGIPKVEGEIKIIITDITAKEKEITDKATVVQQIVGNIEENRVGRQKKLYFLLLQMP